MADKNKSVLDMVTKAASKLGGKLATAQNSEAVGINEKKKNIDEYMDATKEKPIVSPQATPQSGPPINPKAQYGDRPGEVRIDTSEMTKPLGSFKKGTDNVPKTGTYKLHKNEAVISAEKNPMNPDNKDKNMYGMVPGMAPKPKKEIEHMKVRKAKTGGFIVEHHHTHPVDHKMEEHAVPDMPAMHEHMEDHMGMQNPGEEEAESAGAGAE